jgi:sugar/nucleoside kinase (ribokinase family)
MTLAVFGSVGNDDITTPSGSVTGVVGGSSIYFSLAASLFAKVRLAANVGGDFPELGWQALRQRDIDLEGLQVFSEQKTFHWKGSYSGSMNEAVTHQTDLNVLTEPPFIPDSYKNSPFLFLANTDPKTQILIKKSFSKAFTFADTMNLWIDTALDEVKLLLKEIDGLVLNDAEAQMLTQEKNLILAGHKLCSMGPKFVVIKKGEHGSILFSGSDCYGLPAFPVEKVVDPTGAGDSFAGGMMGALAADGQVSAKTLHKAMAFGTVCASFTVEDFSINRLKEVTYEEILSRYQKFKEFLLLD